MDQLNLWKDFSANFITFTLYLNKTENFEISLEHTLKLLWYYICLYSKCKTNNAFFYINILYIQIT